MTVERNLNQRGAVRRASALALPRSLVLLGAVGLLLATPALARAQAPAATPAARAAATPAPAAADTSAAAPAASGAPSAPGGAPASDASPVASGDAANSVRLRSLEKNVNELKEQIFRTKARLNLLKETVLGGTLGASRAVIRHKNEMGSSYSLIKAV